MRTLVLLMPLSLHRLSAGGGCKIAYIAIDLSKFQHCMLCRTREVWEIYHALPLDVLEIVSQVEGLS